MRNIYNSEKLFSVFVYGATPSEHALSVWAETKERAIKKIKRMLGDQTPRMTFF